MVNHLGLGFFPFARRYLGNRIFFLFLRVLRCFSSPGSPPYTMYSCMDTWALPQAGFPIRKSLDQRLLAPPRSLSQLTTSFIGSQRQGIHPTLFITWPFSLLLLAANHRVIFCPCSVEYVMYTPSPVQKAALCFLQLAHAYCFYIN